MNLRITETALAVMLAYCFASVADFVLRRRSGSLREWNEAFLAGLAIATALLFPLTLLTTRYALAIEAVMLLLAGLTRTAAMRLRKPAAPTSITRSQWISVALAAVPVAMAVQFMLQNLRVSYNWDGFQIWATKAFLLYHRGGMTQDLMVPGVYDRILDYPFAVPLFEALIPFLRGRFEWEALKPVFLVFYVSMLVGTYYSARALVSTRAALIATGLLSLLPAVSTGTNVAGYADMPQAAAVAGALSALLSRSLIPHTSFHHPFAWVLAGVAFVKSEGILLVGTAALGIGLGWLLDSPRGMLQRARGYWRPLTVLCVSLAIRVLSVAWIGGHDPTYGPVDKAHLIRATQIFADVVAASRESLANSLQWGLFWPACLACGLLLLVIGDRTDRSISAGTLSAIAAYTGIFLFSNWDIRMHISSAYDRLLTHIAPCGALVLVLAYARVVEGSSRYKDALAGSSSRVQHHPSHH